jgi:uncharacterized membrane protein YcjF (UPF0283 family)
MVFKEIELEGVDWINFAWNRDQWWVVVSMAVNLVVLQTTVSYLAERNISFSRRTRLHGVGWL